ncbi:MAG: GIY-YIG nuclease superfamily protein [Firmicutes bacterium ADurb.Bin248]|nr:MAG: GIY-YIG nuclease superfamily protein [Firmicutes bacterium ADurb.Bin248]
MTYYAYMLRCADGTLYSGCAADLAARVAAHNAGRGAKYTRARLPAALAYSEAFETRSEAMRRENEFKRLTRAQKLALIAESLTTGNG